MSTNSSLSDNNNEKLSRLRQQLHEYLKTMQQLCWELGDSGPLIMGSYYQVYKTCTQPNCKCQRGEKHGPFPALSWSADGKRKMVMVKAADAASVQQKANAYRTYQKNLAKIRRQMERIDTLLGQIRLLLLEEYPKQ
jgi:hypothetical protein